MTAWEVAFWLGMLVTLGSLCWCAALLVKDRRPIEPRPKRYPGQGNPPWPPRKSLPEPESRRLTDQVAHPAGRHSIDGDTESLDNSLRHVLPLLGCRCRHGRLNVRCPLHGFRGPE